MENIPKNNPEGKRKKEEGRKNNPAIEKRLKKFFDLHRTFYSSNFFISGLPAQNQNPKKIFAWESSYLNYKVRVKADIDYGLPYGIFARIIQIWIDTQLVLGEYEEDEEGYLLNIGNSVNDFIKNKLKLADNSGQYYRDINEQILRYSTCNFELIKDRGVKYSIQSFTFFPYRRFIISKKDRKVDFRKLIVSRNYGNFIIQGKKAFPIPENLLYLMSGSSLGIDFLRFIIWRTYTATKQNRTIIIPMKDLARQLAPGTGNIREVSQRIKKQLFVIKNIWKGLKVNITEGRRNKPSYLIIKPSDFLTIPKR